MAGKRIGLVIGNNYPNSDKELKFAVADAKIMGEILEDGEICGFKIKHLLDATTLEASLEIESILRNADNDLVLIYYSGHGKKDFEGNLCLLFNDTRDDALLTTSLPFDFIIKCTKYPSRKSVIIILDCCYSGVAGTRDADTDVMEALKKNTGSGTIILTSTGSTGSPTAREDEKLGHGIFTYHLIEGLEKGYAANLNGLISIDDLYDYAYKKTTESSKQVPKREGRIEGIIPIGQNPKKIRENEYELKKQKFLKEFREKLPFEIFIECQIILKKSYNDPSSLNGDDNIVLGYINSLLKENISHDKCEDIIQLCIEAVQQFKGVSISEGQRKLKEGEGDKKQQEELRRQRGEEEKFEAEKKLKEEEERKKKEISDRSSEGIKRESMGLEYYNQGEYKKAIEYSEPTLKIAKELGDTEGISNCESTLKALKSPKKESFSNKLFGFLK